MPGGASRVRSPLGGLRRLLRVPGAVAAAGRRWLGTGNRPGGLPGVASCARVSLGALALVLAVLAVPEAVLAQTPVTLVKNTDATNGFVEFSTYPRVVQKFTAGSSARITSIQVWIKKSGGTRGLTVKLMQSGGTYPGEEIFTFDSPDTIKNWLNTFTVPDDATEDAQLEEDTEYFIEMQQDGGSGAQLAWWAATGGDDEEGLTDWTVDDRVRGYTNGQWHSFGNIRARLRIWGFEPDAATGAPTISGTARTGHTLTVDTSEIADTDGLTNVSYTFRWFRVEGNTETDVGTNSTTYTVVPADVGKQIGVEASFTDDGGGEETLTSAAVTVENTPATGAPLVLGTPRTGQTLTADTVGHRLPGRAVALDLDRHAVLVAVVAARPDGAGKLIEIALLRRLQVVRDAVQLRVLRRVAAYGLGSAPGVAEGALERSPVPLRPESTKEQVRPVPGPPAHQADGAGAEGHAEDSANRFEILEHGVVPLVVEAGLAIPGAGALLRRLGQLLDGINDGLYGAGHGQRASR